MPWNGTNLPIYRIVITKKMMIMARRKAEWLKSRSADIMILSYYSVFLLLSIPLFIVVVLALATHIRASDKQHTRIWSKIWLLELYKASWQYWETIVYYLRWKLDFVFIKNTVSPRKTYKYDQESFISTYKESFISMIILELCFTPAIQDWRSATSNAPLLKCL